MIERVALAIQTANEPPMSGIQIQEPDQVGLHNFMLALAALEAMREPTDAMILAGEEQSTGPRAYRAMIVVALGDAT